jgi:hypothetical protein
MAAAGVACDKIELHNTYHGERYSAVQKIVAYDRRILGERGLLFSKKSTSATKSSETFPVALKLDFPESVLIPKPTGNLLDATGLNIRESVKYRKVLGHTTSQVH